MILSTANQQKLKYATYLGEQPVLARDEKGKIIYDVVDGSMVARETGESRISYTEPKDFLGNINFSTGWVSRKEYGVSIDEYQFTLLLPKDYIDLRESSLVWQEHEPVIVNGYVDPESADYRVERVAPALTTVKYILQKIDHAD